MRPVAATLLAVIVRGVTILALVRLFAPTPLLAPSHTLRWAWIALTAAAELLTYPAYLVAYRSVHQLERERPLGTATLIRIVVAGFGPVAVGGGFGVDRRVLTDVDAEADPASAAAQVSALSSLEWAVLAPVTWLAATGLLISGANVSGSLLWPWVLGVPLLAAVVGWVSQPGRSEHWSEPWGREIPVLTPLLASLLSGIGSVRRMAVSPRRHRGAWIGMTLYWVCEIAALYGAVQVVHLRIGIVTTALAYSTGYLASRRSLPLGGAGLCEALLVYSLDELRQPIGPAIVAVLIYRIFNFVLIIVPALVAHHQLERRSPAVYGWPASRG